MGPAFSSHPISPGLSVTECPGAEDVLQNQDLEQWVHSKPVPVSESLRKGHPLS